MQNSTHSPETPITRPSLGRRLLASVASFMGLRRTSSAQSPASSASLIPPGSIEPEPTTLQRAMRAASSGEPFAGSKLHVQDGAGSNPEVPPGERRSMLTEIHAHGWSAGPITESELMRGPSAAEVCGMSYGQGRPMTPEEGYASLGLADGVSHASHAARTVFSKRRADEPALRGDMSEVERSEWRALVEQHRHRVEILDAKRQDLEARLRIAEARAEVREASLMETARLIAEVAGYRSLRDMWEARADALRDAVSFVTDGPGDADWLAMWSEGDPIAIEELEQWRARNDGGGATGAQPELSGAAVVGRNGVSDVQPAMGRERPGAAEMPAIGTPADPALAERRRPTPRTADMGEAVAAMTPPPCDCTTECAGLIRNGGYCRAFRAS